MLGFDITPFLGFRWRLYIIKAFPMQILHTFTHGASQVLVRGQVRIKSGLVIEGRDSGYESAIFKGQERPVNRIQGNGRNSSLDPLVDSICRRMVIRRGQLSKDLKALMGEFKTLSSATILERFQSVFDGFCLVGLHQEVPPLTQIGMICI